MKTQEDEQIPESRGAFYGIVLGTWAMVVAYAVLHDQYIAAIAPEHFTVYHPGCFPIKNFQGLIFMYSLAASFGPGLLLGLSLFFVSRKGALPKISCRRVLTGVLVVIASTEIISFSMGLIAHLTRRPLLPEWLYPELSGPLMMTQTIQIFCYALSALFSAILLIHLFLFRRRRLLEKQEAPKA